ncbi:MAG: AzlC family ABC transporter permease [Telmatospirillum sp.]|nr:AzlC family ABC transporter permease [Telmatospirillum sp.]
MTKSQANAPAFPVAARDSFPARPEAVAADRPSSVRTDVLRGVRDCFPLLLGLIPFALVLGAQAAGKGLSVVEVPLMTGLNYAGGSEFAAVGLWDQPPPILLIAAVTFLVNSRHLLMGAALAPFLDHLPLRRLLPLLFFMCDESWALGLADARRQFLMGRRPAFSLPYYAGVAAMLYGMWVLFTTLGAAIGPLLGDVRALGLDMAFPAVFLVLLKGMWPGFRAARPWLGSLLAAAGAYLLLPGAWYVAVGAVSGVAAASLLTERT